MVSFKSIQTEVDASYLYDVLSKNEDSPDVKKIFAQMSEIEMNHAIAFLKNNGFGEQDIPKPSLRAKTLHNIGKVLGYDYVLGVLLDTEKGLASNVVQTKKKHAIPSSNSDTAHVSIVKNLLDRQKISGTNLARFEKRHRSVGGNALRAAVLGGNDGLVSNFSLTMGIAGATNGQKEVLLAGIAGLLAGALSMALGEWISVKSSQELYENQMELEMDELENDPIGEEKEISLIYASKGIPELQAQAMAKEIMNDKGSAHQLLIKEELGIQSEELKGSAMEAAVASFILFSIGAIIPVLPYLFIGGYIAIIFSTALSAIGLFLIGASITLFTGKSIWQSGIRQVIFGLAAAAITFSIGKLIGISIS